MKIKLLGIDLAKNVFQLCALNIQRFLNRLSHSHGSSFPSYPIMVNASTNIDGDSAAVREFCRLEGYFLVYIPIETYATQSSLDLSLLGTSQTSRESENYQEEIMINTRITENRARILSLANQHGIKSMKIFGSMARGDDSETSDADFLVEMEEGFDLFDLGSCLIELQDLLHCKVDMVTKAALHPRIRESILKEAQSL